MSRWTPTFCVTCIHFDIEKAAKGDGTAFCPLYEKMRRWDFPATVLYERDRRANMRMPLIEQLQKKHPPQE